MKIVGRETRKKRRMGERGNRKEGERGGADGGG